jgi:hypothetical protein
MLQRIKQFSRQAGLVTPINKFIREPYRNLKELVLDGGPIGRENTARGLEQMIEAAKFLEPLAEKADPYGAKVKFLSGKKYWYQTIFCFHSLQANTPYKITPIIYDDGSFDDETRNYIRRVVPWVKFVGEDVIASLLESHLPASRFPVLRARREGFAHFRKLIDLHIGETDWSLVLDSDMIFFREPTEVSQWFQEPSLIYIEDVVTNYGYPPEFLAELVGSEVPEKINVGLYGLDSYAIDWDKIESWCKAQLEKYGPAYLQEQGLTAMMYAGRDSVVLPAEDYIVLPNHREGMNPRAILHHYVAYSKKYYFQRSWKLVAGKN